VKEHSNVFLSLSNDSVIGLGVMIAWFTLWTKAPFTNISEAWVWMR